MHSACLIVLVPIIGCVAGLVPPPPSALPRFGNHRVDGEPSARSKQEQPSTSQAVGEMAPGGVRPETVGDVLLFEIRQQQSEIRQQQSKAAEDMAALAKGVRALEDRITTLNGNVMAMSGTLGLISALVVGLMMTVMGVMMPRLIGLSDLLR
eukprot:TRINITY_DN2403_c0_g1_i1.p1 TRINITY_DN2403_c0_g1~~TRINITY_DN2403_c0_g1_i1.p1  ORF type:complete len:152 (-),score=23.63 TRINITY_DN2403_c0_g1_i1:158-613(-)